MTWPPEETFICEVEVLREEMQSTELVIDGEFMSYDNMINKHGLTTYFGKLVGKIWEVISSIVLLIFIISITGYRHGRPLARNRF